MFLTMAGAAALPSRRGSRYVGAEMAPVPDFMSTDWILAQFGKRRAQAQQQYRALVRDGVASRPCERAKRADLFRL